SIPAGAGRIEEAECALPTCRARRATEPGVDLLPQPFTVQPVYLQIPPHGVLDQHAVLTAPGDGRLAEQPVLPRTGAKTGDAGVDATRVRLEQCTFCGSGRSHHLARDRTEAEQTGLAVLVNCDRAEELR